MDGEATRIDTQSNGIIDKREGNKRQQTCQYQQNDTDFAQIVIHAIHQILLVSNVSYLGIFLQFTLYPSQRITVRSEEHTSELQSRQYLVCRLLLEKKKHH